MSPDVDNKVFKLRWVCFDFMLIFSEAAMGRIYAEKRWQGTPNQRGRRGSLGRRPAAFGRDLPNQLSATTWLSHNKGPKLRRFRWSDTVQLNVI